MVSAALDRYPSTHPELHHVPANIPRFLAEDSPWATVMTREAAAVDLAYFEAFLAEKHEDFRATTLGPNTAQQLLNEPIRFQGSLVLIREEYNCVETRKNVLKREDDSSASLDNNPGFWVVYRGFQGVTEEEVS